MPAAKTEILAYQIRNLCAPIGWNLTIQEVADELGVSHGRVKRACEVKGWFDRLRAAKREGSGMPIQESELNAALEQNGFKHGVRFTE